MFSDIGPIKRARFLDKGIAEVVYVRLEDAKEAISKYHRNELDGRPMLIDLVSKNDSYSTTSRSKSSHNHHHDDRDDNDYERSKQRNNNTYSSTSTNSANKNSEPPNRFQSFLLKNENSSRDDAEESSSSDSGIKPLSERFRSLTNEKFVVPESISQMQQMPKTSDKKMSSVDPTIISQILFNKKTNTSNSNPVTFTVKI